MTVNISSDLTGLVSDLSDLSAAFSDDQAGTAGTSGTELMSSASATATISAIQGAMTDIGKIQSTLGASINRLNDTAANLQSMQDNTNVAIGNIMDTDS